MTLQLRRVKPGEELKKQRSEAAGPGPGSASQHFFPSGDTVQSAAAGRGGPGVYLEFTLYKYQITAGSCKDVLKTDIHGLHNVNSH